MIRSYDDAIVQLQKRVFRLGIRYDLSRFDPILHALNHPERDLPPVIHVAGTNGKGSTATFIKAGLQGAGYTVGLFTSPHLVTYRERFLINHHMISEADFLEYFNRVSSLQEAASLTEFELLTVMSLLYFRDRQPDYVIYEVGLGGRLDATNVVTPTICVITQIGRDHEAILGDSLEKIAGEKAGIIKPGVPVVTITQADEVMEVFHRIAESNRSSLYVEMPFPAVPEGFQLNAEYQRANLALALRVLRLCGTDPAQPDVWIALQQATIGGRFERVVLNGKLLLLDGAHNPNGIEALISSLKASYPSVSVSLVISISRTKSAREMLALLGSVSRDILYCPFDEGIVFSFEDMERLCPESIALTRFYPFDAARVAGLASDLIVLTGSLYFVGYVKACFAGNTGAV